MEAVLPWGLRTLPRAPSGNGRVAGELEPGSVTVNTEVQTTGKVAILVGGGPAPGINGVISAATIRCLTEGRVVLGIEQGFKWIMQGDVSRVRPLTIEEVSRLHFRGGSILKTARANPTTDPRHLEQALNSLSQLGVTGLITIGGDDTCFSALTLERAARGRLREDHVPLVFRGRDGAEGRPFGAGHRESRRSDAHVDSGGVSGTTPSAPEGGGHSCRSDHQTVEQRAGGRRRGPGRGHCRSDGPTGAHGLGVGQTG